MAGPPDLFKSVPRTLARLPINICTLPRPDSDFPFRTFGTLILDAHPSQKKFNINEMGTRQFQIPSLCSMRASRLSALALNDELEAAIYPRLGHSC